MSDHLQIIEKTIDGYGVHLRVKDKRNGLIHLEGHKLEDKDKGNRTLLKQTPIYYMPE